MKEIWRNLDGPQKKLRIVELRGEFEFSRPKVAQKHGLQFELLKCKHLRDQVDGNTRKLKNST